MASFAADMRRSLPLVSVQFLLHFGLLCTAAFLRLDASLALFPQLFMRLGTTGVVWPTGTAILLTRLLLKGTQL
jgi:hypothetical protein